MTDGSNQASDDNPSIVYSADRLFRAVKDDSPAGWVEDDRLVWQAQYYDAKSDSWERGGYYASSADAVQGARRGKSTSDMLNNLIGG